MRTLRVFTRQALRADSPITLEEGPSHHLGRVLRVQPGQAVVLFNGEGGEYPGVVSRVDRKSVCVQTGAFDPVGRERARRVHLGLAVIKPDRFGWAIEKATELGVDAITPLVTRYTDQRLKPDQEEKKRQHWQQIAISACEQCGRNQVPVIHAPQSLPDWLGARDEALKLVADPHGAAIAGLAPGDASVALLIGPEGGLTADEVQAARGAGFMLAALGPAILRAETAAIAALVALFP